MSTAKGKVVFLFLVATIFQPVHLCIGRQEPLHITPYLERGQADTARALSIVDRECVEEFVPDSFSGYMTTNKERGHHLFFWFFPAINNRSDAPVILWLNGGPSISSLSGLFWEHGPMTVDPKKSDTKYERREYSWVDHFSVIYLDNPVGTGFSYSDGGIEDAAWNITQQGYVDNMASFLKQFFELFFEFKDNDFYIGGQSYAGKYVPSLAYHLHKLISSGESSVNLAGVYIGAPFFYPEVQQLGYIDYLFTLGTISDNQRNVIKELWKDIFAALRRKLDLGINLNISEVNFAPIYFNGYWDNYVTGASVPFDFLTHFINESNADLKKAIHVGDRPYLSVNYIINKGFANDFIVDTSYQLGELMNNYKVLIYNGDYDLAVSTPALEYALMNTLWNFQEEYNQNTSRLPWKQGSERLGFFSLTDKFCRVVIHGAGHQIPREKPREAIIMMKQFTRDGCVHNTEEKISPYVSASPSKFHFASVASSLLIVLFIQIIQ